MDIKKLYDSDLELYDKLVKESVEGTIFHTSWWRNLGEDIGGRNFITDIYGIFENNKMVAAIPISYKKLLGIRIIYNGKLTPYSGPVFIKKDGIKSVSQVSWKKKLNRHFAKVIKKYNVCLYYPLNPNHIDVQPYIWEGFDVEVIYTNILELNDLNKIQNEMEKKRRNEIKSGLKSNLTIIKGQIDDFLSLYQKSMGRQNHLPLSPDLWRMIFTKCKKMNSCEIFTAYCDDDPLASLFLVWDDKRSYYLGGGIGENPQNAMSLLVWEAIQFTKNELKLDEFDFEGSSIENIESFFRSFGGNIQPIYRLKYQSLPRKTILTLYLGLMRILK